MVNFTPPQLCERPARIARTSSSVQLIGRSFTSGPPAWHGPARAGRMASLRAKYLPAGLLCPSRAPDDRSLLWRDRRQRHGQHNLKHNRRGLRLNHQRAAGCGIGVGSARGTCSDCAPTLAMYGLLAGASVAKARAVSCGAAGVVSRWRVSGIYPQSARNAMNATPADRRRVVCAPHAIVRIVGVQFGGFIAACDAAAVVVHVAHVWYTPWANRRTVGAGRACNGTPGSNFALPSQSLHQSSPARQRTRAPSPRALGRAGSFHNANQAIIRVESSAARFHL